MGRGSAFLQLLLVCQLANGQSTVGTPSINIDPLISALGQLTLSTDTSSAITTLPAEQSILSTQADSEVPSTVASAAIASDSPAVTSTMTTQPSGFLTVLTTDPAFTENRWITTEEGGHTTVLPVIVGCPGCGPDGATILKHLPEIPRKAQLCSRSSRGNILANLQARGRILLLVSAQILVSVHPDSPTVHLSTRIRAKGRKLSHFGQEHNYNSSSLDRQLVLA